MTKQELIKSLEEYPDDTIICVTVLDTVIEVGDVEYHEKMFYTSIDHNIKINSIITLL